MAKISIIIPVYNAEKYISRCLDSVINSTYKDIEILLMNDGSCDNSLAICKEYQNKYKDIIKVFSHHNQGVSMTRNKGIKKASGEYVMFIDNDDYIDRNYIMNYYRAIANTDYDAVFGGYQRINQNKAIIESIMLEDTEWSKYRIVSPWAKIYRTKFLKENKIEFLNTNIGEDIYFNAQVVNLTDKIKIIDDIGYKWFYNDESVSNTVHKRANNDLQFEFLLNSTYDKLTEIGADSKSIVEYFFMKTIAWFLFYINKETPYSVVLQNKRYYMHWLKRHYPNYLKNSNLSPFTPKGESLKNRLAVYLLMIGSRCHFDNLILKIFR